MQSYVVTTDRFLQALNNGEFEAYIQPVIRTSDLRVVGGELLVRWHTPAGKIIPPACFIDQIESVGLLSPMTCKLMLQVIDKLSAIRSILPEDFRLAVNVTPTLLSDREFIRICLSLVRENKIRLILELTEQHSFYQNWQNEWILNLLDNAGVELSLDDFGTGCSVLEYLKDFPIHYIKIDKCFIQDVLREKTSKYIVECVASMAKKMNIGVVAEGVETQEQVDYLKSLGVEYLQGFYFGKPKKLIAFCYQYRQ